MFREVIQALLMITPWLVIGDLGLEETCVPCHMCATGGIRLHIISIKVQTLSKAPRPLFSPVSQGLPWLRAGLLLPLKKLCLQFLQPGCCQLLALSSCPLHCIPSPQRKSVTNWLASENQIRSYLGYAI